MRSMLVLALLGFSQTALAGSPIDKWYALDAGEVVLPAAEGTATLIGRNGSPMVAVTIGGTEHDFRFELEEHISISEALAGELGLRVKHGNRPLINWKGKTDEGDWASERVGGEVKWARVDEIQVAGLVLKDVRVLVTKSPESSIGLLGIQGISWAFDAERGAVVVAPAGSDLLTRVGGPQVAFSSIEGRVYKDPLTDSKQVELPLPMVVNATINGTPLDVALDYSGEQQSVREGTPLPEGPVRNLGEFPYRWTPVTLGGASVDSWVTTRRTHVIEAPVSGMLSRALQHLSYACDNTARQCAFKVTAAHAMADYPVWLLEQASKAPEAPSDGAQAPPPDEDPKAKAKAEAGKQKHLARKSAAAGNLQGALDAWAIVLATEGEDRDCTNWQGYAGDLAKAGRMAEAITAYTKAADLYHGWWSRPVEERESLQKDFDGLKEDADKLAFEARPQAGACHTADGGLAAVNAATGNHAEAERLYREHLDLDAGLALALGSSALVQGKYEAANEPLRQASHVDWSSDVPELLGIAIVKARTGRWDGDAAVTFQALLDKDDTDPMLTWRFVEHLAAANGAQAALTTTKAWAQARPDSPAAWLGAAFAAKLAGDTATLTAARAQIDLLVSRPTVRGTDKDEQGASKAIAATWAGDLTTASSTVDALTKRYPASPATWWAAAVLAEAKGESSTTHRSKASSLDFTHPGYALLATPDLVAAASLPAAVPAPAPEPAPEKAGAKATTAPKEEAPKAKATAAPKDDAPKATATPDPAPKATTGAPEEKPAEEKPKAKATTNP